MKPKFAFVSYRISRRLARPGILPIAMAMSLSNSSAPAADIFWDRGAATNAWGTVANWSTASGAATPNPAAVPGASDVAVFNISTLNTAQTIDLGADRTVAGLRFVSTGTVLLQGGGANRLLNLGASGITKTGTGAITIGSATANQAANVRLTADQTWANNHNTGAITVVNGVQASSAVNRLLTLGGSSTAANTVSGVIANNGAGVMSITKSGAGTWRLAGANTHTGVTTIAAGTLIAQHNSALGTTAGNTVIEAGATLDLGGTLGANTLNLGAEAITVSGAGVGGNGAIVSTTSSQQNAIQGVVTMVGNTTFGGSQRWDIRNGTLNGGGFNLTKVGANSVFISGSGQMTNMGGITVNNGEFVMETGALASSTNTTGILLAPTTGGTTASFRSWGNNVDHSANFTLDSSVAGTARLAVDNGITTHSGTITALGTANNLDVLTGHVMNVTGALAGSGALNKVGAGTVLINNAGNTHSGAFNLNVGTLGGVGTLSSSALNIAAGTTLSPGLPGAAGTLSVTNAIVSAAGAGGNTAVFNLGTASDLVNVGTLTQDGTTNVVVNPGAGYAPGTYKLYDYTTLNGGTGFGGFSVATHIDASLVDNVGAGSIDLQVNSTAIPVWSGVSNGIWQSGSMTNPVLPNFAFAPAPGGQVEFVTNDAVLFDDTAVGTTNILTSGTIAPISTRFNNSAKDYSINGAISGIGSIVKDGSGTAALLATPTTDGGLVINAGTLQLGSDSLTAGYTAGSISIAGGSTLAVSAGGSTVATLGTATRTGISGNGTILLNSTQSDIYHNFTAARGQVTISGDMTGFTGNIVINDGNRLTANTATSLGSAAGITINDGGSLYVTAGTLDYAGPVTVSGLGWKEPSGSLGAIRLQAGTLSGPVNLVGDTRITANSGSGTISGVISGAGANLEFGLRQIGGNAAGTLDITNPLNTYSGNTSITRMNINAATIANAGVNSSLGAGSVINLEVGSLVVTGAGAMSTDRTININQGGQGGATIGVADPTAVVTFTGAITNGNASFPISTLDFVQRLTPGTGGTVVLNTATPIRVSGTTVHRANLTLAGNTQYTVDWATTGTTAAPLGTPGAFNLGNNQNANDTGPVVLTIQDAATLTTYGEIDMGNANSGAIQNTTVNQTGGTVNALRGGLSMNGNNRAMRIGHWPNNNATYNLSGGTLNAPNGAVTVGWDGTGTINQSGGTANVAGLRFANSAAGVGVYNLDGGTLNIGVLGMSRAAGSATLNFNGGTYRATADHAISSNIVINANSGGTIDTNGFNVTSASALLLGGGGGITKAGAGEFVLPSGNNTIAGTTQINGGAWTLGAAGTVISASTVNVNSGGTLAGLGEVSSAGGVIVAPGGTLSPGLSAGFGNGTLKVSSAAGVSLADGAILNLTPGGDLLDVTAANGLLTPAIGKAKLNVLPVGTLAAGTVDLISYNTAIGGGGFAGLDPVLPHLTGASVVDNGLGKVQLIHTGQETLTWTGGTNGIWSNAPANVNWNASTSGAVHYLQGDVVVFDDSTTPGNTSIVVAAGGVTPAAVAINDAGGVFSFTGGAISGGTSLTKSGAGTTVVATNNNYLGTTTISAGTLQIGNGGTIGTLGQGATTNDGTLAFNRSDASVYAGAISGTGIVRSDGTGTTTLAGGGSYSGGTVISKGALEGRQATSFGTGTITLNDASTGSADTSLLVNAFNADGAVTVANNIVVANNGTGTVSIGSSERSLVAAGTLFTGTLSLGRDVTLLGEFDRTTFSNVISGTADTITIARSPGLDSGWAGRVTWEGNNTFGPATASVTTIQILEGAILQAGGGGTDQIPDSATVNVQAGGTFQLSTAGDSETIGNLTGAGTVRNVTNTALTLTFGTADDTTFSGVINGGNSLSYTKVGSGTATWSGILDNPTGNITVNEGTLVLAKDSTPTVHALGGASVVNSGGILQLGGTFTYTRPEEDGRNDVNSAPRDYPANYVDQIYNDMQLTVNAGGVFDLNGRSESINGFLGAGTVRNSAAATNSILYIGANDAASPSFSGLIEDGAGTVGLIKLGTGTQTLSGANTYTGITEIRAGNVTISNPAALGSASTGTLISGGKDAQNVNLQLSMAGGTIAAPIDVAEPFTMVSETSGDQRSAIINLAASTTTRLTGDVVVQGDGISQFTASQTAAGSQFIINSNITGTATGVLFLRGASEMQLNGVITAPSLQIAKTDAGLLILNSTGHDYLDISLVHGTVRTDVANAFDPTAVLRMGQSGNSNTLNLNGNSQTVAGLRTNIGVTDANARTVTSVTAATLTINTPALGGDYAFSGNLTGGITLVKTGAGTQALGAPTSGVNSYSGDTVIQQGVLKLAGSNLIPDGFAAGNVMMTGGTGTGTLDLNGNSDTINGLHGTSASTVTSNGAGSAVLTLGGSATPATSATFAGTLRNNTDGGAGVLSLIKTTANTQILSGTNTYSGSTTVTAGRLQLDFAAGGTSNILSASSALGLNGGTLEIKGGAGETNTQTFNGVGGTGGTLQLTQNGATGITATLGAIGLTGSINFAGANTTVAGGIATAGSNNFITSTTSTGNDASVRLGGHLWNGTDWASTASDGVNTYVTKWAGTYATLTTDGSTANPTGELRIEDGTAAGTAATFSANTAAASLLMAAPTFAATMDLRTNTLTIGSGANATGAIALASNGQSLTIGTAANQGVLTAGSSGASTLALNNLSASANLTINSVIADNTPATGPVSLNNTGNVVLSGTNTYTGVTTLNTGVLSVSNIGNGGVAGNLGQATSAAANLVFNSGTLQYTGAAASTDRAFTITPGTNATLDIAGTSALTMSGVIPASTGGLIKTGTGTLILTGANAYNGATNITTGILQLGDGTTQPTINSNYNIEAGGTLKIQYNTTGATGVSAATWTKFTGAGRLLLTTGKNFDNGFGEVMALPGTFTGTLEIEKGRAAPASAAGMGGTSTVVVKDGGQLGLYFTTGTLTQNFIVAGAGYGETNYESALRLSNSSVTLSGSVTLAGNTTLAGGGTNTISGPISENAVSNLAIGTSGAGGTMILSGTNTYTGTTTVNFGTAQFAKQVSLYNANQAQWTNTNLIVKSGTTAAFNVGGIGEFGSAEIDALAALGTATDGFVSGSSIGLDTTNAVGPFTYATNLGNPNAGANALGFKKLGTGTLVLTGTNSYTGATAILGGTLQIGGAGSLGGGTYAGAITNNGILRYDSSTAQTLSGVISGTGSLIKDTDANTLTLTGANTFTGGITLSAGTVQATVATTAANGLGTGAVSIAGGTTVQIDNTNITATTPVIGNVFTGAGLLKLNFAANTTARNTTMNNVGGFTGTIQLSSSGATGDKWSLTGLTSSAAVIVDSGTQMYISGAATTFNGGITVQGTGNSENRGAIRLANTLGGNITLAGDTAIGSEGGTITGNIANGTASAVTLTVGTASSTGNSTFSGSIGDGASTVALTKTTAGTMTLSGTTANTYTGKTTVDAGILTMNKTAGVTSIAGDIDLTGGELRWTTANQVADTSNLTLSGTGLISVTVNDTIASVTANGNTGKFNIGSNSNLNITGALALTGNNGAAAANSYSLAANGGASNMTVGSLALDNAFYKIGQDGGTYKATLNLNGDLTGANTSSIQFQTGATTSSLVLNGTGAHNHNFNITSGTTTVSAPIAEAAGSTGSLTKLGSGTLILAAGSSYTGQSVVSAGSLYVNGSLGNTATSVAFGATLGGTGTVGGPVDVSGTLTPGASIESLSTGALTMNSGSTFVFEATGNGVAGADLLTVNGPLSLTNVTLNLAGADLSLGTWLMDDKLTLISYTGAEITSGFTGYADGGYYLFGANYWRMDYNDTIKGNNFAPEATGTSFVTMTLVPEPSTALLGGFGLLALLRRRRK